MTVTIRFNEGCWSYSADVKLLLYDFT